MDLHGKHLALLVAAVPPCSLRGRRVTCYKGIRDDRLAGALYEDALLKTVAAE